MRYLKAATFLSMALVILAGGFSTPASADVSFGFFYSNLGSSGSWLVSAEYGRVWQPRIYAAGWHPYHDGHWVYTDLGWTWVSDYPWGAIPYHYGTWVLDPAFGWVWVPGYTWAPSWVVFRTGPDYIGWAPVSPGFSVGVSGGFVAPAFGSFVFVSSDRFLAPHVHEYVVPVSRTRTIVNRTKIVNNFSIQKNVVVNRGPDASLVERATGRRLRPIPIERVSRVAPGSRVDRAQLRIDPARERRGIRAAEPVSDAHFREAARESRSGALGRRTERSPAEGRRSREPQPRRKQDRPPGSSIGRADDDGYSRSASGGGPGRLRTGPDPRRRDEGAQSPSRRSRLSRPTAPQPESVSRGGSARGAHKSDSSARPPRKKHQERPPDKEPRPH